ncbi:hypothetical protein [Enterobacter kobei]|uniref:hypothetical protein n=1 Tax=Enterobacter kobei TaxID=208224 RepID=UPI00287544A9|nr:hypothetical protein [Enterobacter kobei]MDS0026496.1 hypothetical protein [Enterobacter kobei]
MEPILLLEQPGYVLNSLLVPLLNAAATLLLKVWRGRGHRQIKTWRIRTGTSWGPFQIYDIIGLRLAWRRKRKIFPGSWARISQGELHRQGSAGGRCGGGGFYDD